MDFVIGHPRSGTMFVNRLLEIAEPGVSAHELLAVLDERTIWQTTEYYEGRIGAEPIRELLGRYDRAGRPRIDCNYKLVWILPLVRERHPEARILHLVRDPRPNIASCYNLDYYGTLVEHPAYQTDPQRNAWVRAMPRIRRPDWARLSQLERNCAFWTETHRLSLEAATGGRYLRLRLEDLHDRAAQQQLFSFFSLPLPDEAKLNETLRRRINLKLDEKEEVRTLRSEMLGDFADWRPEQRQILWRECGPMARRLGYDLRG